MACSSADWVRGLARLISSAMSSWPKIGPGMKRKLRLPPTLSSSTSLPTMSDGMRSGVNWMRRASRPSALPLVSARAAWARRRGEVGGERDAARVEPEHDAHGLDQLGLGEAGKADEQRVPAREHGHERL